MTPPKTQLSIVEQDQLKDALLLPTTQCIHRLELGRLHRGRASAHRRPLFCESRELYRVVGKFPNLEVGEVVVGEVEWVLTKLRVPEGLSAETTWLAVFLPHQSALDQHAVPDLARRRTTSVVVPAGPFVVKSGSCVELVRRDVHVTPLSRVAGAPFEGCAEELALYSGTLQGLACFGDVVDWRGAYVKCLSLCFKNHDKLARFSAAFVCKLLKLPKCTALRTLAIWLPVGRYRQNAVQWQWSLIFEVLKAVQSAPVDHVQLVLDVGEAEVESALGEIRQMQWRDIKCALLGLTCLQTITVACAVAHTIHREELFGVVMDRFEVLRQGGVRIAGSTGPLFTVPGFTAEG